MVVTDGVPEALVQLIEVRVAVGPEPDGDLNARIMYDHNSVRIVYRGGDLYAVTRRRWFLTTAGAWEREPAAEHPARRADFATRTRYPYSEALPLALAVAHGDYDGAPVTYPPARQ